jgi:NitT/TauT family transport system permease protein
MVAGAIILICVMQGVGALHALGPLWPTPSGIVAEFWHAHTRDVLLTNTWVSMTEMFEGLAAGLAAGTMLAIIARTVPVLDEALQHFAVIVQAVPIVAVAPILLTSAPRELIPATLASIGATFTAFMASSAGLRAVRAEYDDLFRVLGSSRWRHLVHLGVPAAVPALLNGVTFAIPGAVVGAVIGEWFGASRGIGIVLLQTMRAGNSGLLFAASALIVLITLAAYGITSTLGRLAHWSLQ